MKKTILYVAFSILFFACSNDESGTAGTETSAACQKVIESVNVALNNYNNATQGTAMANCENYKKALQSQISVCGDVNGDIKKTIDALKDCTLVR
ncbi:MAG: hypothetical protein AB8B78_07345 [Polaribacter sp.]